MNRESDLEVLQEAKPFLRSAVALLLYLRFGSRCAPDRSDMAPRTMQEIELGRSYEIADMFLALLEADMEKEP